MREEQLYIRWETKFELGIPIIDKQHRILVEMCNELYQGLLRHRTNTATTIDEPLKKTLHDAVAYVKVHFATEEKLMLACGYPNFEEHKKKHQIFIAKILDTAQQFEKSPLSLSFQLVKFIYDWILEHIAFEDRLYVKTIQACAKKTREEKSVA